MELIEQLFELYVRRGYPPDILSYEYEKNGKKVIHFGWFSGKVREFGFTCESYEAVWKRFNTYWASEGK